MRAGMAVILRQVATLNTPDPPLQSPPAVASGLHSMTETHSDNLRLTDFMDLPTLQEIQDSFAAVANVKATITDAQGNVLTQPMPDHANSSSASRRSPPRRSSLPEGPQKAGREYVAPIIVNGQRLGTIRMAANGRRSRSTKPSSPRSAEKFGIDGKQIKSLLTQLHASAQHPARRDSVSVSAGQRDRAALLSGIPASPAHQRTDGRLQPHDDARRRSAICRRCFSTPCRSSAK